MFIEPVVAVTFGVAVFVFDKPMTSWATTCRVGELRTQETSANVIIDKSSRRSVRFRLVREDNRIALFRKTADKPIESGLAS